jgi:hypothetical protein
MHQSLAFWQTEMNSKAVTITTKTVDDDSAKIV